jgi:hypothetical protein
VCEHSTGTTIDLFRPGSFDFLRRIGRAFVQAGKKLGGHVRSLTRRQA